MHIQVSGHLLLSIAAFLHSINDLFVSNKGNVKIKNLSLGSSDLREFQGLSFLDRRPRLVGIVRFHLLGDLHGARSEVFLVNLTLLIDDKGHYSRFAPV